MTKAELGKSGVLNLRMPPGLHERLVVEAAREGVSLNQWMVTVLEGSLDKRVGHLSVSVAERAIAALEEFVTGPTVVVKPTEKKS